jgi:hypothetical protein
MGRPPMATAAQPGEPGFISVFLDIPFPTSIPNGNYTTFDPIKGIAVVTLTLREGTRAFFRNRPIVGPTSFRPATGMANTQPRRARATITSLSTNLPTEDRIIPGSGSIRTSRGECSAGALARECVRRKYCVSSYHGIHSPPARPHS